MITPKGEVLTVYSDLDMAFVARNSVTADGATVGQFVDETGWFNPDSGLNVYINDALKRYSAIKTDMIGHGDHITGMTKQVKAVFAPKYFEGPSNFVFNSNGYQGDGLMKTLYEKYVQDGPTWDELLKMNPNLAQ